MGLDLHLLTRSLSNEGPWTFDLQEQVTSTSDLAKTAGVNGAPHGLVICAEEQTAGRGQRNNRWVTPRGRDLMFSMVLRPQLPVEVWPRLTTLAAVAVCRAIEQIIPAMAGIKWPNDVHLQGKKVSGLLAETAFGGSGGFVVLGVGINVNTTEFPEELRRLATSLRLELGPANHLLIPREPLLAAFLDSMAELMDEAWEHHFQDLLMEVRRRSVLIGRNIRATVDGLPVHGRVRDLNHEGHLILERVDGTSQLLTSAAEVRVTE